MKVLALTIGNNDYCEKNAILDNAINDARAMNKVFSNLGYDVEHRENLKMDDCIEVLGMLKKKVEEYDVIIFYYAGHGFEVEGENYLVGIEGQIASTTKPHLARYSISLSEIFENISKDKINIIIIDACRKALDRGAYSSFSSIKAPKGTLIAFSTSPNEGAKDGGADGHSIYTKALLNHIGKERLSVEELFKKVRQTVYNWSGGTQTTWEHTSLIGDFIFNNGQLVVSVDIPYDEKVVKDSEYALTGSFGDLIGQIKSHNYYKQNPAIDKALAISAIELDKNQQFILGRNLLQAAVGGAWSAANFIENIDSNIEEYNTEKEENHLLNGILFEMYFNNKGEFRNAFKKGNYESIFALRKKEKCNKSIEFLQKILEPYYDHLWYIPSLDDEIIDVNINAIAKKQNVFWGQEDIQVINKITVHSRDITKIISSYFLDANSFTISKLGDILHDFLFAPKELIKLHTNINLEKIYFALTE